MPVTKSFDATTLLGVLIDWGIISVLLIDGAATGAWQDFDQTSYVVDPVCPNEKEETNENKGYLFLVQVFYKVSCGVASF